MAKRIILATIFSDEEEDFDNFVIETIACGFEMNSEKKEIVAKDGQSYYYAQVGKEILT